MHIDRYTHVKLGLCRNAVCKLVVELSRCLRSGNTQRVVKVMGPGVQILYPPLAHLDSQLGLPEPGFSPMCRGM